VKGDFLVTRKWTADFLVTRKWRESMAGKKGKSGRNKGTLYTRVHRITVTREFSDLLPFFKGLDVLPPDRRNEALLAAIRGGAATAQKEVMSRKTSAKAAKAIEALASAFDLD
jgi:hypothetical protein